MDKREGADHTPPLMARVTVEDCLEQIPNRFALTVLASRERVTKMPTLGLPLRMLKLAISAKLSLMVATSARRTT